MADIAKDLGIVRELAKKYMEIAVSDRHVKMRQRFKDTNDLKVVRPPLIMEEIPWDMMNYEHELDLVCEDPELRGIECHFRRELMREKYFRCDNFIVPYWSVGKSFSNTGNGMRGDERTIAKHGAYIVSHEYHDVLADESALDNFHMPVITAHPENDVANVAHMQEIFGDIMPVVLRGHGIYYAPWDQIAMLRGVTPILIDMLDRPEYLHRIISLYTKAMMTEMDQMEAFNLYDPRIIAVHSTVGEFTPPTPVTEGHYGCKDIWFRTMAQIFVTVSPEAHNEFDVQYSIPLAKRCAYTYYGCCDQLHDRFDMLLQYPNLRKVGVPPLADPIKMAELCGNKYVYSRKPNPANVAIATDPEVVREETEVSVKACIKNGCASEYVLKDISTVNYNAKNLMIWSDAASRVLDKYYGEE